MGQAAEETDVELPTVASDGRALRRQGRVTMGRLLDAGVEALATGGYHATRVDDIVRLANVSHGTFYLYFADKEALFRVLAQRCADETTALAASLGEVAADDAGVAVLADWLSDFLALYRSSGVVIRAWAEQQVTDRDLARLGRDSFGKIAAVLTARIPDQDGDSLTSASLRATALLAMIERFAYVATSRDLGVNDAEIAQRLAPVVHRGFFRVATSG